jgi:ferredoxin
MIIAEQKSLDEIKSLLAAAHKVLVVGCGTCVTVCFAGGEKEAQILAASLRMATKLDGDAKAVTDITVQRQCEWEYIDPLQAKIDDVDIVLSLGCGIGVQALAERFPNAIIVPGLNTTFLGLPAEQGVWAERCAACGDCILGQTGGICPIARCSKSLLNGPCGGSAQGKCEVNDEIECAWQLIYDRLKAQNRLELLLDVRLPKNWRPSRDGGPRKIVREDLRLEKKT